MKRKAFSLLMIFIEESSKSYRILRCSNGAYLSIFNFKKIYISMFYFLFFRHKHQLDKIHQMSLNSPNNNEAKAESVVEIPSSEDVSIESKKLYLLTDNQIELILGRLVTSNQTSATLPKSYGNPGPLGLAAFALTTFMLSVFNAGSNLIDSRLESVVLPVALFYGGIAQFAAGMWEYQVNNTFGATTFASYGGFWMSFAGYVYYIVPNIASTTKVKKATGLYLLSWFIFTIYMNVAAWRVSKIIFSIFTVLNFTFLFLIIGNLGDISVVTNIGGWFGIVTAFLAWYASAAMIINTTFKKNLLPIGVYREPQTKLPIIVTHF